MSRASRSAAQALAAGVASVLAACTGCGGPKPPASAAPRLASALAAALRTAEHARAPWRCVAEDLPELVPGALGKWNLVARGLARAARDPEVVIGVIADAGGADPKTLAALGRLRAKLDEAHAELVLALGGMGASQPELEATLGVLAKPSSPVVALPGDLEPVGAQAAAIAALAAKGAPVVDGRLVRWIDLPDATLGLAPGAGSPLRLAADGDGCAWQPEDVLELYQDLSTKPGLRIAVTAEAPREGAGGVVELAAGPALDLVVHGPTQASPSPPQGGSRDGSRASLSPGTADATPRLPATRSPSAGVLVVRGSAWTWRPLVDSPVAPRP